MVVCQFFLRGTCRFGTECRNEHPVKQTFGSSSWNRATTSAAAPAVDDDPNSAQKIQMRNDMTVDKPIWPLSSYGPAKYEPQLISGLDESPEELRVKAFEAVKTGKLNEYMAYESNQIAAANEVYRATLLEKKTTEESGKSAFGTTGFGSTSSTFGSASTPSVFGNTTSTSVFGKPATTSAFGQPAFGQTSTPGTGTTSVFGQPTTSAFGQPASVFGQPSTTTTTSAFGQPSAFGQAAQNSSSSIIKPASGAFSAFSGSAPSAFGSTAGGTSGGGGGAFSAFAGKPSAFASLAQSNPSGGSVFGQPSFGQPVPAATTSVFGQPAPAATTSVFGQPATNTTTSVFGQPAPAATSVFGQPAPATTSVFGQPAQPTTTTSVFGQPAPAASTSVFGQPAASTSVFGTPATGSTSVFGTPGAQNNNSGSVFGAPSTFGQPQTQTPPAFASNSSAFNNSTPSTSVFGKTDTNPTPTSVFGSTNTTTAPTSVFGNPSSTPKSVFGQSGFSNPQQATSVFGAPSAFGTQTNTSVFGAQPTQPISAFAPTAPSISAEMKSATSTSGGVSDFASLMGKYNSLKISTPYDDPLKDGYADLLSKGVLEAFKNEKFEFGKVPEFLPLLEAR